MDARTSPARIVVGVDGSESATEALAWAIDEAALTGATVEAVHAWHYPALTYASVFASPPIFAREDFEAAAAQIVDRALSTVAPPFGAPIERIVVEGPATKTLVDRAHGAELLVVGHRGWGGIVGLHLGSVALQCAMHAECPVVVVRGDSHPGTSVRRRVVVGVDGAEPSRRALLWAADEARRRDACLEVVHCWHARPALAVAPAVDEEARKVGAQAVLTGAMNAVDGRSVAAEPILVDGPAASALIAASSGADLVVMGTRGHGGFAGLLLGSVSTQVLHHAHCPTVIVR
jgi:nucleotide-binding universal stress UspA family protein